MKQGIVASVMLMALVLFSGLVFPENARADMSHHGMMMHGGPVDFYLMNQDKLSLTPSQVEKLTHLKMDFMKAMIMEKAQIRVLHMETMMLMMKHHVDTGKAEANMDAIMKHKRTIMRSFVSMVAKAHSVLTDDQFMTARKLWRQMMMMHHEMMMHHHPAM